MNYFKTHKPLAQDQPKANDVGAEGGGEGM